MYIYICTCIYNYCSPPDSECFETELRDVLFTISTFVHQRRMIAYSGRLSLKQFLPAKPTKYVIKFFCHMRFGYRLL